MNKSYMEWCEITGREPNKIEEAAFEMGAVFNAIETRYNKEAVDMAIIYTCSACSGGCTITREFVTPPDKISNICPWGRLGGDAKWERVVSDVKPTV